MLEVLRPLLATGGLYLPEETLAKIKIFHDMLLDWNTRMAFTNVPEEEMPLRHYADSLLPLVKSNWFPEGSSLIDVGTGAGFPGLALAVARPDLQVCLLEALQKRCTFLTAVCDALGLSNVKVLHARAEDAARENMREYYDIACARAVAPLRVLAEYLLPFVRTGGQALCWKGPSVEEELREAKRALSILGGAPGERYPLPLAGVQLCVQAVTKKAATPAAYPRKAGTPKKKPL